MKHHVDSLVLHGPAETLDETLEIWRAMEAIADTRGARQLGISNCYDLATLQDLYNRARVKPAVVQNRFYKKSGYDRELRQWCGAKGIRYQSFWTVSYFKARLGSICIYIYICIYSNSAPDERHTPPPKIIPKYNSKVLAPLF